MVPLPKRHWTPRYVADRLARAVYQWRKPHHPWLTSTMNKFLAGYLRPTDTLVEFGSGRSTIWFARRTGRVISVETYAPWHAEITRRLAALGLKNVEYHCVPQNVTPADYFTLAQASLAGSLADVTLIDGDHRGHAALWALEHVRPGGVIVIDNVNWFLPRPLRTHRPPASTKSPSSPEWTAFAQHTKDWRTYWTSDGICDTTAFFKPMAR